MKKFLVVLMVMAMVGSSLGCATMWQKVCNPTVEEQNTIGSYKAQATILLAFLESQIKNPEVLAAITGIQFALSVYDQVLAGVCTGKEVIENADKTVVANQKMARATMKYRY